MLKIMPEESLNIVGGRISNPAFSMLIDILLYDPGLLQRRVADLHQSEIVSEDIVVFVISTSGTGKEPRTMTALWRSLLRSDLPDDFFEDLRYAVFGLGDSSYEKFCWPAKKLSRRLEYLGATPICLRAEGDTQHVLG